MKQHKRILEITLLMLCAVILILDAKTSLDGARYGIKLCLTVVIPSLFPFLFLSAMMPERLLGIKIPGSKKLTRILGIPEGTESLLILGFLGGYPVGASIIVDVYKQGKLSKNDACRMLGFCNNAGPAFLFGMVSSLFSRISTIWILWIIHIFSAILVGILLPNKSSSYCRIEETEGKTPTIALNTCIRTMAIICGWVVIFRIILTILDRWILWMFPIPVQACICGLLELTNGIAFLQQNFEPGIRFVLSSAFLAFGGLCITMQTLSVTADLGPGMYFPGKLLQASLSIFFSSIVQHFIFPREFCLIFPSYFYICLFVGIFIGIFFLVNKKVVAYPQEILYNTNKFGR